MAMTTEQAHERFAHSLPFLKPRSQDDADYIRIIGEALREKERREKGCEYCKGDTEILLESDDDTLFIDSNEKVFYSNWSGGNYLNWGYCPMCGRKLVEE